MPEYVLTRVCNVSKLIQTSQLSRIEYNLKLWIPMDSLKLQIIKDYLKLLFSVDLIIKSYCLSETSTIGTELPSTFIMKVLSFPCDL